MKPWASDSGSRAPCWSRREGGGGFWSTSPSRSGAAAVAAEKEAAALSGRHFADRAARLDPPHHSSHLSSPSGEGAGRVVARGRPRAVDVILRVSSRGKKGEKPSSSRPEQYLLRVAKTHFSSQMRPARAFPKGVWPVPNFWQQRIPGCA